MQSKHKIGAIVRLKSGGPCMTVYIAHETNEDLPVYQTCWFVGGDLHRDGFSEPELESVEGDNHAIEA